MKEGASRVLSNVGSEKRSPRVGENKYKKVTPLSSGDFDQVPTPTTAGGPGAIDSKPYSPRDCEIGIQ
jgi:hypothetical protein